MRLRCSTVLAIVGASAALACGSEAPAPAPAEPEPAATTEPAAQPVPQPAPADDALRQRARQAFGSLPEIAENPDNPVTPAKADLGRMLYYDPRLSKSQSISCNSCHDLAGYGVDNEPTSPGHQGQRGVRNSPTVYNAAFHVAQFWDGRAADVEEQAKGPVTNPVEMAMPDPDSIVVLLESIPGYEPLFADAFPDVEDPITVDNMARAIAAFERSLTTPAPFDDWLAGDDEAMTEAQIAGLRTFLDTGCTSCHTGATVGGQLFMKLGVVKPYPTEDAGRFEVTGNEADRHVFKVPSLRNVEMTGPWLHDGSIGELEQVVRIMAEHQLGRSLTDEQVGSIVAFLGSLTGTLDLDYVAEPELPESGPDTPAPDPT